MRAVSLVFVSLLAWSNLSLATERCPSSFTGKNAPILEPGEVIGSVDVPVSEPEQLFAWVKAQQGEGYLLPLEGNADALRFNLLWHPDTPWQGGRADIILTDGEWACPAVGVTIAPLQRADGALDALLALLTQGLENEALPLGKNVDSLREQEDGDIPALQILSAFSLSLADDADPQSFANLLASMRADPEQSESLALMEALLAATGLLETMYEDLASRAAAVRMPDDTEPLPPQTQLLRMLEKSQHGSEMALVPLIYQPASEQAGPFLPVGSTSKGPAPSFNFSVFPDAKSLSEAMYGQFHSETGLLPDVQIYRDAAGALFTAGNALATVAGNKKLGKVYDYAGQGLFIWTIFDKLRDGLYPHKLLDMKIAASNDLIYVHTKPDGGVVNAIWVTPRAKGLDMSKIALDFVLQYLPVNKLASTRTGSAASLARNNFGRQLGAEAQSQFQKSLYKAQRNDGLLEGLLDTSKWTILGKIIEKLPGNGVIPPFDYPPVNIYQRGYVDLKLSRTGVVEVDFPEDGLMIYRAVAAGRVLLNAYTRSGKFGNTNATAEYEVRVRESQGLHINPGNPVVMPGETIRLFIAWGGEETSLPPQFVIDFQTSQPTHQYKLSSTPTRMNVNGYAQWVYTLDVSTKANEQLFPIHVSAWLKERPDIKTQARIDPTTIVPGEGCIEPDSTVTFRVPVSGGKVMQGLSWRVLEGPGQISRQGVYQAPAKTQKGQSVRIEVRSQKGLVLSREMRLSCGCEWRFSAYGQQWEGDKVSITSFHQPGRPVGHMLQAGDDDSSLMINSDQAPGPGSLRGVLNATLGQRYLFTSGCTDENHDGLCDAVERKKDEPVEPPPPTYTITSVAGGFIEGVMSGQAIEGHLLNGQQSILPSTPFSFRFRAKPANLDTQDLGLARALVSSAGYTSEATLAEFAQLSAMLGVGTCDSDPEWEQAKRGRRRGGEDDYSEGAAEDEVNPQESSDPFGHQGAEEGDVSQDYTDTDPYGTSSPSPESAMLPDDSIPLLPSLQCINPGQVIDFYLPATHSALRAMLVLKVNGTAQLSDDWRYQAPAMFEEPFVRVSLHESQSGMRLAQYFYTAGCNRSTAKE
ncbi:hypothetical protein [Bowmanella yangjiangensis]|uniref:Uncharacterized protein n=1 Tax=Bowmanella yangjiangensis TaxID=2811230 RepID=A0ABS3CPS5_9ALTE|nr:hypothetical protein [Bowmanella yangjiangensis]MBN7818275.1 hypothetical protein [Bowmanella yangjiangensis]